MPAKRLTQQVSDAFQANPPGVVGVAVSGGGDSMALLHLMHGLCALHGSKLRAVTVDHGLRSGSSEEADFVAGFCATLGISHDTLRWDAWDGTGNLQNEARKARYDMITGWANTKNICTIALGHTADDQAETVLMHLARRAGVNGLAGMPARSIRGGISWVRPLLAATRQDLRSYLTAQHIGWIDDPSNEDTQFARVRARKAVSALEALGIDARGLSEVASNMALARSALDWQTFLAARDIVVIDAGAVVLDERKLRIQPEEIQRRLLVHAVNWISGADYPPRRAAVANLMAALRRGQAGTADGVHARRIGGHIWVFRELNAVKGQNTPPEILWDQRWHIYPAKPADHNGDLVVRALGQNGLEQCPDWRATGRPHVVLLSTPAVWRGDTLVDAPLAGPAQTWHAQIDGGEETFFAALLTH